jgi:hypothetical protein
VKRPTVGLRHLDVVERDAGLEADRRRQGGGVEAEAPTDREAHEDVDREPRRDGCLKRHPRLGGTPTCTHRLRLRV